MRAKEHKKLSEDKERYKYKKVLTKNGIPIPGLWQRLGKFSVYVSIVRNGRIVPTFIPLKAKTLQKAIDECQKLQAFWAKERNNFKIHEITEDALKEEVYLLTIAFASELHDLKEKKPSAYQNYVEDIENKGFLKDLEPMIKAHEARIIYLDRANKWLSDKRIQGVKFSEIDITKLNEKEKKELIEKLKITIEHMASIGEINYKLAEQKARETIDSIFKEVLKHEDDENSFGFESSLDAKLENILKLLTELKTKHNNSEADIKEGENFSKALEHYQKSRRKAEGVAFGSKSNTAFKIIQNVIYPLETQIRIVKALLRYCPKEDQQAKES